MTITTPVENLVLGRTATGTRVHGIDCPHLVGKEWHLASEAEVGAHPLCDWSEDQLSGHGRSHPETLEAAMREQGTPEAAKPLIKELLASVGYDEIWLPYSRSYVALGLNGRAGASFGKTYAWVDGRRVDLPGHVASGHQGHRATPPYGEACPITFEAHPLTGECDRCN